MDRTQSTQEASQQLQQADQESTKGIENPSYHRSQPFIVTDLVRKQIAGAIAEIDPEQIRILRTKTVAERVQIAASMINDAEQVGAYRLRQREPELSEEEALRIVRGGLMNYLRRKRKP